MECTPTLDPKHLQIHDSLIEFCCLVCRKCCWNFALFIDPWAQLLKDHLLEANRLLQDDIQKGLCISMPRCLRCFTFIKAEHYLLFIDTKIVPCFQQQKEKLKHVRKAANAIKQQKDIHLLWATKFSHKNKGNNEEATRQMRCGMGRSLNEFFNEALVLHCLPYASSGRRERGRG